MYKVKATAADLLAAANDLSPGDLAEFQALHGSQRCPVAVLTEALDDTTHAIKCGALVLAVGGHGNGIIWFVTTNVIGMLSRAERFRFYRILKDHYRSLKGTQNFQYSNCVSTANHAHIRLLESLGATFAKENSMSPAGFQFKQFWL
ncbi:phage protein Gp13 family protein [Pseudomonas sp. PSPC3-3]|uniref:phage protein Gp13 family protein n=1 Tax=unclassified Pseudomonas TaxID=196821 RepID=UPI003CF20D12